MSIAEVQTKEDRVRAMMAAKGLDALLVRGVSNFAWLTDGASNFVSVNAADGNSWLLFTPTAKTVICNNIEATRLRAEEGLEAQGCQIEAVPWHVAEDTVARLTPGMRLGVDGLYPNALNVSADLAAWRMLLLKGERERLREIAAKAGEAIQAAALQAHPGMSEYEIAGALAKEVLSRGMTPIVNLVGVDERIWQHRHPLATAKVMQRYAMLALGARCRGLVAAVSRLIHYGPLPEEVSHRQEAVARVDATLIAATRPGAKVSDVFRRAQEAYAAVGFPEEWQFHHQGGAIGYEAREYRGTPTSAQIVQMGQAFAWNPSIAGVKSEDTILVEERGNEIITAVGDWPTIAVEVDGQVIRRPAIKVVA